MKILKSRSHKQPGSTAPPGSARGRRLDRRGAGVVETAVIAPVFFLLIFGIVEFCRMVQVQQAVANASRIGCRTACLRTTTTNSEIDDAVRNFLKASVPAASDATKVRVTLNPATIDKSTPSGTVITVMVDVNFSDVTWMPGNFLGFGNDPVLRATTTMQRE